MKAAAIALCALLCLPPVTAAQELGRLFLSPRERAALDTERRERTRAAQAVAAPPRVQGYVQRSGGRTTVWVNGTPRLVTAGARTSFRVGEPLDEAVTMPGTPETARPGTAR